ncbi:MAG: SIS domain-containing protein [Casimicrobiaceae bacterium]
MAALSEADAARVVAAALSESADALQSLRADRAALGTIARAAALIVDAFGRGGRVFSCGNGGSMCDAMHLAEELSGRFRGDRKGLPASAISDPGHLSCVANDFGYEAVFARYLESHGRPGDVLVAISTSGSSRNVLAAARAAREIGMEVVALTGRRESALAAVADCEICTPAGRYADRVQELHIKVIHILIELIERSLFPENYAAAR